jgi:hypothetical protein
MYVLVFTLVATGQIAFYSGDPDNRQHGRPTIFPTLAMCEETRAPQAAKMIESRKANPNLPAYTLECMERGAVQTDRKPSNDGTKT